MTAALVGSVGTAVQNGTGGGNLSTLTYGQSPTANNLLVCMLSATRQASSTLSLPGTPSGWTLATPTPPTPGVAAAGVYYKIAAGGDAAPTFSGVTSEFLSGQLAEFSGCATSSPVDQTGSGGGTTSPQTVTTGGTDVAAGELVVVAFGVQYSSAATKTFSMAGNNGMSAVLSGDNQGSTTRQHYAFGYGITTGNGSASDLALTFTTTAISNCWGAVSSFLLGAPPATSNNDFFTFF